MDPGNNDLNVLIVEDSETDTKVIVRELRRAGFSPSWQRVDTASALSTALAQRRWQLVISDSSVPRLGPLDALALTRQLQPDVPFIVVSGTITEETAVAALRAGAADYVRKDNLQRLAVAIARELPPAGQAHGRPRRGTPATRLPFHRMIEAQEAGRRRIARQLHDDLGHLLTTIRLTLDRATQQQGPARDEAIAFSLQLVDQAMEQARDFSRELWPTVLDDLGLGAALEWLAERQSRWLGSAVKVSAAAVGRLPFAVEAACFRVAQEALTNVVRHAGATAVEIALRLVDDDVELSIRDDGRGFDPAAAWALAAGGASLGLLGMRERALLAGGWLDVESTPGAGTTVRAHFPGKLPAT